MTYSLPELVLASGVPVDTVRYYQTLGLLDPPRHEGRSAVYEAAHLDRLRLIRSMSKRGLSLKVIGMLLKRGSAALESDQVLLTAIEEEAAEPSYSRAELAAAIGVPQALLLSVEKAGLAEAQEQEDGTTRYTESDLKAARGALGLLGYGFPLTRLLTLAARHHRAVRRSVDEAIELFDAHVRKREGGEDPESVARAFKEILPLVTALVAHHFQRLLITRALKRLKKTGDRDALRAAVEVSARTRLGLRW
jgi:DNA-binding transcriptional MerR regulator